MLDALETGLIAGLLAEPAPGRVRFAHALVRDTLYADLTHLRRTRMHGRLAEVLRRLRPDDLTALAHHYASAASARDAPRWPSSTGFGRPSWPRRRYAHDRAAELLEQALASLDRLPAEATGRTAGRPARPAAAGPDPRRARSAPRGRPGSGRSTRPAAAGRDDLVLAAFTAWTVPTPWQTRRTA